MNSPWGLEFAILKDLGISRHEMLWKISWLNLVLMRKDAPSVSYKKKKTTAPQDDSLIPAGQFEDLDNE